MADQSPEVKDAAIANLAALEPDIHCGTAYAILRMDPAFDPERFDDRAYVIYNWAGAVGAATRSQIVLDTLQPNSEPHGGPAITLTCQSAGGTFAFEDVIYFNAVAQATTFVDAQTLTCTLSSAQQTPAGTVPVQVMSADTRLQSNIVNFTLT